jgi:DNA-binding transcriptional MerR regulator
LVNYRNEPAVSVRMLRYYEDEGLLHPRRTSSGYREYGDAEEQTVRRIRLLGAAGLTLETIRQILPCVRNDRPEFEPCDEMRAILRREVKAMNAKIEGLDESRQVLSASLQDLD